MKRGEKTALWCGIAYGVIAIVTFGHSAADKFSHDQAEYAACRHDPKRDCLDDSSFDAGASGMMSALLWPLYWSWETQQ